MPNSDRGDDRRIAPVIDWLMRGETRALDTEALLHGLADRLQAIGIGVDRMTTGIPILHPQVASYSGLWQRGRPFVERRFFEQQRGLLQFAHSPPSLVYQGKGPIRCRLNAPAVEGEFAILQELRDEGLVEYIALGAPFSDGTIKAMTFATRAPDGFQDDDVACLESIMLPLAMVLEVQTLGRTAHTLLQTYVGREAGDRVLDGAIRRGMGETINAVIWLSDLRGFTALTEALPQDRLLALLNDYFGAMGDCVEAHGGEVLKFIGDAMLAIFAIPRDGDAASACTAALAAANDAMARLAAVNADRAATGAPEIRYGIGLHIGDVMYGNIGSETRLDFTVIGPAVNLAARIEGLCGRTGARLLTSADFERACDTDLHPVGTFDLKGVGAAQQVFGLDPT